MTIRHIVTSNTEKKLTSCVLFRVYPSYLIKQQNQMHKTLNVFGTIYSVKKVNDTIIYVETSRVFVAVTDGVSLLSGCLALPIINVLLLR